MASFPAQQTSTSDSTDTPADDGEESADETTDEPGLLDRLATHARTVADVLSPFTELLTALVQAGTVYTFVRGDLS